MTKKYQVVGIGNALVDVLASCDDSFLSDNGVEKGIMQLIDTDRAAELYGMMGPATEISGGSAANTIAGIAALGGRTAYVGKVKDDQLGDIFAHDMRAQGADYDVPRSPKSETHETGRCMVLVTPDSERSLNTYLGVSEHLGPDDIDTDMMAEAEWIYLEGYRFDGSESKAAFAKAIEACKSTGGKVSFTLSDPFCVDRHHQAFRDMIRDHIDLLFCNEHEMAAMYPADTLDESIAQAAERVSIVACTVGAKGAIIVKDGERTEAPAEAAKVVDVTGAGDLFAAGFLHGLVNGRDMLTCGRMGCIAAGEIISHIGARPEADLGKLFREKGLE
ncbi:adenosine kinase [Neptunicoccus cionae]|uniref:adenosine kinase n=1 Tax=Neptunicoccus cionae TaxID=2035344 RepID=UPI000C760938|nr:adenosine kinase [Amylibacter cionae]PLS23243.1 adenosine kinase [Amylibacter cionae]